MAGSLFYDWNRDFAKQLKDTGFPYVFVEDDGNHFSLMASRIENSLVFVSTYLDR